MNTSPTLKDFLEDEIADYEAGHRSLDAIDRRARAIIETQQADRDAAIKKRRREQQDRLDAEAAEAKARAEARVAEEAARVANECDPQYLANEIRSALTNTARRAQWVSHGPNAGYIRQELDLLMKLTLLLCDRVLGPETV